MAEAPVLPPDDSEPPTGRDETQPAPVAENSLPLDDEKTDRAIDEITAAESDQLLSDQDTASGQFQPDHSLRKRNWLVRCWRHRWLRYGVLLCVLAALGTAAGLPKTRYWALNHAGVRASVTVRIVDDVTQQPLKNIRVQVGTHTATTDGAGRARVDWLLLGPNKLVIGRDGFSTYTQALTVGWGSNPQGTIALKAVGVPYTLQLTDYVTGTPIAGATISNGDAVALSDASGRAVLVVPAAQTGDLIISADKTGYRGLQVPVKALTTAPIKAALVTSRKVAYVSKQSGHYDLYSSDIDGQNSKVIFAGSGAETPNISLAMSPDGTHAALVSVRGDKQDADGYQLGTLTLVSLTDTSTVEVARADQIQLVGWVGSRIVFEEVAPEGDASAAGHNVIISYDFAANSRYQLASAAHMSAVLCAQNEIVFAVGASTDGSAVTPALYKIDSDGGNKQTILQKDVWTMYRTDYDTVSVQASDGWYSYQLSSGKAAPASSPAAFTSRQYIENPAANGQSAWIDTAGSQGVLLNHAKNTGKDAQLQAQAGLAYPLYWFAADSIVYRVVSGNQAADYIVSAAGGQPPHKIADVVNTYGFTTGL